MAIRYVKDFEFPSAAGYTKSSPSKVTGQMFAKGGQAKAPKGLMVMIGVGAPKKGPIKKSEGSKQSEFNKSGYDRDVLQSMMNDIAAADEAERIMRKPTPTPKTTAPKAKKPAKGSPYIPGTNIKPDPDYMRKLEGNQSSGEAPSAPEYSVPEENARTPAKKGGFMKKAKGGYAEGGEKKPKPLTQEEKEEIVRADQARGVKGYLGLPRAKGGMAKHDDEAMDKALIKKMVKPSVLKKAEGGMAQKVQMAKSNAVEASLKGQKKTPYADGGMAAAPQSPLQRMGMAPRAMGMGKAKAVPVAPRAPMIAPPSMGQRGVGVNAKRPGGPDVGAIRAAMSKAASVAAPDASPSMMKKGGKAKR
jgi:hypothetical protein